jgi:hypothetical protein
MELREYLMQYKQITINACKFVQEKKYDEMEICIRKRNAVIENIKKLNFQSDDFKNICIKLNILEYERKLSESIEQQKVEIKRKIIKNTNARKMNNYNSMTSKAVFLSKEV